MTPQKDEPNGKLDTQTGQSKGSSHPGHRVSDEHSANLDLQRAVDAEPGSDGSDELRHVLGEPGVKAAGQQQPDLMEHPVSSWFLGPKAEQSELWQNLLTYVFQDYANWRRNYFPHDPVAISHGRRRRNEGALDQLNARLDSILGELKAHFPFYSPRYIAHMLSEQTLPSVLGYFAGMLYNPNNVTDEAAPVTVKLELDVGRMVSEMLGYNPHKSWAHICSGGTVANLEALWVARSAQFIPFIVKDYCNQNAIDYMVKTANGRPSAVRRLGFKCLIGMRPNESIFMLRKLLKYLIQDLGKAPDAAMASVNTFVQSSEYNAAARGFAALLQKIQRRPVIFVSEAAHYSVKKAANILGYGEDAVHVVPVDAQFRINVTELENCINRLSQEEYIAAVIGIVGTTEEGAVDPIHEIHFLRQRLQEENNRSFWLHVDAAWGGYFASIFRGHDLPPRPVHSDLYKICNDYAKAIGAHEEIVVSAGDHLKTVRRRSEVKKLKWENAQVYSAFLALPDADSITVDPHKMGYVPYPAGLIAFKSGIVTELMTQRAQYISDEELGVRAVDELPDIKDVGPYILEGSKPGAAASACWLAHKVIPLDYSGHGRIIRSVVFSAKKLATVLRCHRRFFKQIDGEMCGESALEQQQQKINWPTRCHQPFTFFPLNDPDTNIVCFVTLPMRWHAGELHPIDGSLVTINEINRRIYEQLSITAAPETPGGTPPVRRTHLSYEQPFFVSRTTFTQDLYSPNSLCTLLDRLQINKEDYAQHGLFVLRSTVMNPLYEVAYDEGKDYIMDFVRELHLCARRVMDSVHDYAVGVPICRSK